MALKWVARLALVCGSLFLAAHVGWWIFEGSPPAPVVPPAGEVIPGKAPFAFAVVGDTHCRTTVLEQVEHDAEQSGILFVVHLGDLITHRQHYENEWVLHELAENDFRLPFCPVPGNHDCPVGAPDAPNRYTAYCQSFGPRQYWFACDNALFIAFDDSTRAAQPADLEWLDQTLARLRPQYKACFVYMHVPLGHSGTAAHPDLKGRNGAGELARILDKWNVTAVFSGHIHSYIEDRIGSVPRYVSGGGGGPLEGPGDRHHYLLCHVAADGRLTVEKRDAPEVTAHEYLESQIYAWSAREAMLGTGTFLVLAGSAITFWRLRRARRRARAKSA